MEALYKGPEGLVQSKNDVKEMIKKLRGNEDCVDIEKLQKEFEELLKQVNPIVIAMAEQELLKEGYTFTDLKSACDVHLALFKGTIENNRIVVPEDHPVYHFQEDHRNILHLMESLRSEIKKAEKAGSRESAKDELIKINKIMQKLMEAENHNVRQENTLFPVLEKHGLSAPPAIMWEEHSEMKEMKKNILRVISVMDDSPFSEFLNQLEILARLLMEKFFAHSQKENHILYQTALDVITEEEWKDIKEECDNLGYFEV
jgi:uncharacterized protein